MKATLTNMTLNHEAVTDSLNNVKIPLQAPECHPACEPVSLLNFPLSFVVLT